MMNRRPSLIAAGLGAAICLWPVAAAAQDLMPPADSGLTVEQARNAFASAGFQVDETITWDWTSPPASSLQVHDIANGRVLMVLVYPNAAMAQTARLQAQKSEEAQNSGTPIASDRGPHLLMGYGESVWIRNLAMVETTQSELDNLYQTLNDRDNGVYVNPLREQETSRPHFAVDLDFVQALTNSVANL